MVRLYAVQCTCVCVLHVYMLYTRIIAEPDYILPLMYALAISVPDSAGNQQCNEMDASIIADYFFTQKSVDPQSSCMPGYTHSFNKVWNLCPSSR